MQVIKFKQMKKWYVEYYEMNIVVFKKVSKFIKNLSVSVCTCYLLKATNSVLSLKQKKAEWCKWHKKFNSRAVYFAIHI